MAASSDDSFEQVYSAVGEALNNWAHVEDGVVTVFLCAVSARNYEAAQAAFAEIISFDGKLSACSAAIRVALGEHEHLQEQWRSITRRLMRKKQIRNKLAHAQVLPNTENTEARLFAYYSLCEPGMPDWNGGWSSKTIRGFSDDFSQLSTELTAFIVTLRTELGLWLTNWRPHLEQ